MTARARWACSAARAALVGALAAGAGACTVGSGVGTATGELFVIGCGETFDYGTREPVDCPDCPLLPKPFDLSPTFFAGAPSEDIGTGLTRNRVVIRMQRSGNRTEVNDTLFFNVENEYAVARCLRGQEVGGAPAFTAPWCDRTTPERPRVLVGPELDVGASLAPLFTCHDAAVVAVAVSGWIEFLDFGTALQSDLAAEMRARVDPAFKIDFGDRLRANFQLMLDDQRVVTWLMDMDGTPRPSARIGGMLSGSFDFDLQRGRAAQPFP